MIAGWIANVIWIVDITQRPAIRERTSRSAMLFDSRVKRPARSPDLPIVLPSMIPDTDRDSATSADMFASWPCCSEVIRRRSLPTRRVSHTNSGRNTSEMIASCQSRMHIATSDAITVVAFCAIEVAVVVTTLSRPPMSLAIRDCTSPVRVRVKNASDIRCRWRYTAARRSCITRCPIEFEMYVCHTLNAALAIAIAIIASTSHVSSVVLRPRIPSSSVSRSRNGWSIANPAENTISPSTAASRAR